MRDADVRRALRTTVLAHHLGAPRTLVIDEFGIEHGQVRVDVALINGRLHAFEIKSDADRLRRLPTQAAAYGRVFDRVTLVAGARHLRQAVALIPAWWGLRVAEGDLAGRVRLRVVRRDRPNPGVDPTAVAALLWREEALAILSARGLDRGLRSKPRPMLYRALADALGSVGLRRVVRDALRARAGWRAAAPRT